MTASWVALAAALAVALCLAPEAAAQGKKFYGVSPQGPLVADDFDRMRNGGVGTLRFQLTWAAVEPSAGSYEWAGTDAVIGNAAARGIRALPFVVQPPNHVRTPPTRAGDRKAFNRLMSRLAGRYGPGGSYWQTDYLLDHPGASRLPVLAWQLFNEQNGRAYWGGKPRPRAYGRLVKAGARGVRKQHRKAEVVLGGMFGTPSRKGAITSWRFLDRLYRVKGFKRAVDTVAVHPYGKNLKQIRVQMNRIRKVMRRNGDGGSRTRVTEIGWGSARGGHPLNKGAKGQARMLRKSFRLLARERPRKRWNVRGLNWFSWQNGTAGCPFCGSSGLFKGGPDNRKAKRSWRAFKKITR